MKKSRWQVGSHCAVILTVSLVLLGYAIAQQSAFKRVEFSVRSAVTGLRVSNSRVWLVSPSSSLATERFESLLSGGTGWVSLPLDSVVVLVQAPAFQMAVFSLDGQHFLPGKVIVYLEPVSLSPDQPGSVSVNSDLQRPFTRPGPSPEIENRNPGSRKPRKAAPVMFTGWVSDAARGSPISHAQIKVVGSGPVTTSGENGFFQLILAEEFAERSTLQISHPDYEDRLIHLPPPGSGQKMLIRAALHSAEPTQNRAPDVQPILPLPEKAKPLTKSAFPADSLPVLPQFIRVGRQCSGTQCAVVEVYPLETYCKLVLPAEWYPCWGALSGGLASLLAGAVAIRTVALWYIYHPLSANYDICDNSACQVLGSVQTSATDLAVDSSRHWVVVHPPNSLFKSEYAAENNNQGCGNGYAGTGSTSVCIYDPVCLNQVPSGHGRGMCQWGSVRWATGSVVDPASPCLPGVPHAYGQLDWQEILIHYYPGSQPWRAPTVRILELTALPDSVPPGGQFTIRYRVESSHSLWLYLGASVALPGQAWISDPGNDLAVQLTPGLQWVERPFRLPAGAGEGEYDLLGALWQDRDGNGQINAGDLPVSWKLEPAALTVTTLVGTPAPASPAAASDFRLEPAYPNPFNARLVIPFTLRRGGQVTLVVRGIRGEKIALLVNRQLPPGQYHIPWQDEGLASGIYLLEMRFQHQTQVRKIVLLR